MIDVSRLLADPDFCEPFVIRRRVGKWEAGRFVASPEDTAVTGIVEPTNGDDLEQLPEGDRVSGMMTFYTKQPVYLAQDKRQSDEIIWRGKTYKAQHILDWSRHGFYKVIAALTEVQADETDA